MNLSVDPDPGIPDDYAHPWWHYAVAGVVLASVAALLALLTIRLLIVLG